MIEEWRPILGFEGLFDVSNHGRVRSYIYKKFKINEPKILKLQTNLSHGYVQVCLRKNDKNYMPRVHRLVLIAFIGPCPSGKEGTHNDGNKQNNRLDNLSWKTHVGNMQDQIKHGSTLVGLKNHQAKLNPEKAKTIRHLYKENGYTKTKLAKMFNVGRTAIDRIV